MKRFRGGLVFNAHRLMYHSILGWGVINKKKKPHTHNKVQRPAHSPNRPQLQPNILVRSPMGVWSCSQHTQHPPPQCKYTQHTSAAPTHPTIFSHTGIQRIFYVLKYNTPNTCSVPYIPEHHTPTTYFSCGGQDGDAVGRVFIYIYIYI